MKRNGAILIIVLLAFVLRMGGLADHNIWWDEGLAAWAARLPVERILDWTAHDVHPPLYFLLLSAWWRLVGDGEFVLRFPSALAGTLGVALIYGLGRALLGRRAGTLAALFLALSTFAVTWSQEMRMYILAAALATGTLWAAARMWRRPGWRSWLAYVLTCAAGVWTLYLTVSVPVIANIGFMVAALRRDGSRSRLAHWLAAQIVVLVLYVPWLVYALPRIPTWSTSEPFSPLFFVHLYSTMLAVGIPVHLEAYTLLMAPVFAVLALGTALSWRAARSVEQRAGIVMLAVGLILPAAVVYIVSLPIHIFYAPRLEPRYLLPLAPCFYTLLGLGVAALGRRRRWPAVIGLLLVVSVALSGLVEFYPGRLRRDDLVSLVATLEAHVRPADAVVLHSDKDWPLFAAQYAGEWHGVPNGAPVQESGAMNLLAELWAGSEGVWLVSTPDAQRVDPQGAVLKWLEDKALASRRWELGDNTLAFFARTPARAETLDDLGPGAAVPPGPVVQLSSPAALAGAWLPLSRYESGDVLRLVLFWSRPPSGETAVELSGPVEQTFSAAPPRPAAAGPTRQQLDLRLQPGWPGGEYRLAIRDASNRRVEIGHFKLLARAVPDEVSAAEIDSPLEVRFGPSIQLAGYSLRDRTVEPGGLVELTLYWRVDRAVDARYKVFVHLVGGAYHAATSNFLWGQQDNEPQGGAAPTTTWAPGVLIADRYSVRAAPDAPPGVYQVEVGLYGLVDGARLPILDAAGRAGADSVTLAELEVTAGPAKAPAEP